MTETSVAAPPLSEKGEAFLRGPFKLGGFVEPVVIDGVERRPATLIRDNDGSLAVMAPDPDYPDDAVRIGSVHPITFAGKRGEARSMAMEDDPVQAAILRLFLTAPALLAFAEAEAKLDPVFAKGQRKAVIAQARALVAQVRGE